jgi:aldehyde dehydrogenase (NAD+)
MNTSDFSALVARHRNYFRTGATRSADWREGQLTALRAMMTDRAADFHAALWTDLRRNRTDADLTDLRHCLRAGPSTTVNGTIGWINSSRPLFW